MKKYKSIAQSIKDVSEADGIVSGYLSVFGVTDSDGDIINAGAFAKTIAENGPNGKDRIKFLREHDYRKPIGKFSLLKEDSYGLYFEAKLNQTREGKDALILYLNGELTEHSIGFQPITYSVINDNTGRFIGYSFAEVKLWEGSAVLWGANEAAKVQEIKARFEAIRQIGNLSDEVLKTIENNILTLEKLKNPQADLDNQANEQKQKAVFEAIQDFKKSLNIL
jgi:HK97 family phage prohead protease